MKLALAIASVAMAYNVNIYGDQLSICSTDPMTGWTRDGTCKLYQGDYGTHTTCSIVTTEFLEFSKSKGNNLMDPTSWGFPGLKQGDRWCLCAFRWNQAYKAYLAGEISINGVPKLLGTATHEKTADLVTGGMETIEQFIYRD